MRWIGTVISVGLLGAAIWVLDNLLRTVRFADVMAKFSALSATSIAIAVGLTAVSYLTLITYDLMGLHHIGRKLSLGRVAVTSFTSYVFAHNIGFGVVTGGSVRYRLYSTVGLSAIEIATVSVFCGLAFTVGIVAMGGVALLAEPDAVVAALPGVPLWLARVLGVACLSAIIVYLVLCAVLREPLDIRGTEFRMPSLKLGLGQLAASVFDITVAAFAMYALMPELTEAVPPLAFLGVYVLAILAGVISNVPGGVGVIEASMVLLLPDQPPEVVLAGVLAYRVVYYLLPFAIAALMVLGNEVIENAHLVRTVGRTLGGLLVRFAPHLSGILVMVAGLVLLISGASPAIENRLHTLSDAVPLALLEASHMLASVVGVLLVIVARGLFRRLDAAYFFAMAALGAGAVFSLLKGFDYEEATLLVLVMAMLYGSRQAFYRKTALLSEPFTLGWFLTVGAMVAASSWIGFFAFRHVEYTHDLWWTFTVDADAPRFLRALLAVTVVGLAVALYQSLRPTRPEPPLPSPQDLADAKRIIGNVRSTDANLALLGDKHLLFNEDRTGFVMYGLQGNSMIAMGDPVAATDEVRAELAWSFRELCDDHDRRIVFYQILEDNLPLYVDMGLSLQKLGEEAVIRLETFSLAGQKRRHLRNAHNRSTREGMTFEFVPADAQTPELLAEMRAVSDAWLSEKATREKGFSIGRFTPEYVAHFPCGIVRVHGRMVGFATLWLGGTKEEMSVDLMRHIEDAPHGVMDFLFAECMFWGAKNGYKWFSLGLAPLSGLENHPLAPMWHRVGAFIFRYGENFYNFEGLRVYKSKFDPEWRAKYLATRGGLNVASALLDVSTLISGGLRGIVAK